MSAKIFEDRNAVGGPFEEAGFYRSFTDPEMKALKYINPQTSADDWYLNEAVSDVIRKIVALRDEAIRKYDELVTRYDKLAEEFTSLKAKHIVQTAERLTPAPGRIEVVPDPPGLVIPDLETLLLAVERISKAVR